MAEIAQMTLLKSAEEFISSFNDAWLHAKWDVLSELLHKEVAFVLPDLKTEYAGRQKCIDSIKEYTEHAKTHSFNVSRKKVHIWDSTASVVIDYTVKYEINDEVFAEVGSEVWTLVRQANNWRLVWRALIRNEPAD